LGALGAGIVGATALAVGRPASAAPSAPTDDDEDVLFQAMTLELTAAALYRAAIDAGLSGEAGELARVFADNHDAYATRIAGAAGFSQRRARDERLYDELLPSFAVDDPDEFAETARDFENSMAATHTELLPGYDSVDAQSLTAAIVVVEARMGTVLAHFGGLADRLDEVFEPRTRPITISESEAP
jgi:hypothetical protein